ncbi:hypothetical protein AMJ86_04245 [bacterium SM23_57]|nr:MAG: hypothetical protein AMJ86_04245 [bacterium SM23_57]
MEPILWDWFCCFVGNGMSLILDTIRDALGDKVVQEKPRIVVMAEGPDDVQRLIRLTNQQHFRILVLGSGSSFVEDVPIPKDTVALMMSKVETPWELDEENLTINVGAGNKVQTLCQSLQSAGWESRFLEVIPRVTIGGAIANPQCLDSSSLNHNLRNFILGMKVVHSGGQLMRWGGKMVKDVAGLDVLSVFIGSQGALGVVTEITFRLVPFPSSLFDTGGKNEIHPSNLSLSVESSDDYLQSLFKIFDPRRIFYQAHHSVKNPDNL